MNRFGIEHVVTQGGKDESKEGDFNLLFYAIKTRNDGAFAVVLPKSDVRWQNSIGVFLLFTKRKSPSQKLCSALA